VSDGQELTPLALARGVLVHQHDKTTAGQRFNDLMYLMFRWPAVRISTSAQPVVPVAPSLERLTHARNYDASA